MNIDTEFLITQIDAHAAPDKGAWLISQFGDYLAYRQWKQSRDTWLKDGQIIALPAQISSRSDALALVAALDTLASINVCARVDIWREILAISRLTSPRWVHS